jgi:hypothetical protein
VNTAYVRAFLVLFSPNYINLCLLFAPPPPDFAFCSVAGLSPVYLTLEKLDLKEAPFSTLFAQLSDANNEIPIVDLNTKLN